MVVCILHGWGAACSSSRAVVLGVTYRLVSYNQSAFCFEPYLPRLRFQDISLFLVHRHRLVTIAIMIPTPRHPRPKKLRDPRQGK